MSPGQLAFAEKASVADRHLELVTPMRTPSTPSTRASIEDRRRW